MTKLHSSNLARSETPVDTERLQQLQKRFRASRLMRQVVRPLLMALLVTALMVTLLAVVVEATGDGRWLAIAFLLFFIALEAIYTTNWLNHPRQFPLDRVAYRAAELLLLLVIVRLASWIIFGEGIPDSTVLINYLRNPQAMFLNAPFLLTLLMAFIIWRMAVALGQIFSQLEVSDYELQFHSLPLAQRKERVDDQPIQAGRKMLVEAFARFWLLGGMLLVIAVGISTLEQQSIERLMAPLAAGRANLDPLMLGAILLYFIVGLWLLSQARLMHLHAHWLVNNVDADVDARQKWQRTSLLILILVFVVAAFLPIGSTSAVSQIVGTVLYWLLFLANVIIFLIVLPIALLLALLFGRSPEELGPLSGVTQPPMLPPPDAGPSPFAETIAMMFSSGFWAVLLVTVAVALLFFLRERRSTGAGIGLPQLWEQILDWLKSKWAMLRGQARSLQESLLLLRQAAVESEQPESKRSPWRFLRVRGLSPRDQIRYFYLSTVRRAGERGVDRPAAGTPLEYVDALKQNWPEADEELQDLTEAFLKARYSDKTIGKEDIPPVKNSWKEVRRELRQKPRQADSDQSDAGDESAG